jgi:uncharacterized protein (DUF4415 family)
MHWERLDRMTDEEIRAGIEADPDVHPTDDAFWQGARVVRPGTKATVPVAIDSDIVAWFRKETNAEAAINAALRSYILARLREDENA